MNGLNMPEPKQEEINFQKNKTTQGFSENKKGIRK